MSKEQNTYKHPRGFITNYHAKLLRGEATKRELPPNPLLPPLTKRGALEDSAVQSIGDEVEVFLKKFQP